MNNLEIKNTNIGQIHGYERNARNHPESQIKQIIKSITEFGFNNPILIDEHGEIIAGHGRYIAAKQMGLSTVPSITLSHLNEKQKRAYRLADNKIAENGGWNLELLQLEIKDLEQICAGDLDIRITGFNDAELDQIINLGDTVPADPKVNHIPFIPEDEIVSVLGDIWQIGPHRIICDNSLEESTFNQIMDGAVADTVLQDPPYNVKINGHVCGSGAIHHKEFAMASGEMSVEEFINFLKQNFFLCKAHSKTGALHYNFMDWRHISEIMTAGNAVFDEFINMCVWVKKTGGMGSLYRSQHELCFIFRNGKKSHMNNVQLGKHGRYRTNVWQYAGANSFGQHKGDLKLHPTVKPVEMLRDAILDCTPRGGIVLDSFLGSGSTLIAAQQAGRVCRGIELEPIYIDTTIRRFQEMFGIEAIHVQSGQTYNQKLADKRGNK